MTLKLLLHLTNVEIMSTNLVLTLRDLDLILYEVLALFFFPPSPIGILVIAAFSSFLTPKLYSFLHSRLLRL